MAEQRNWAELPRDVLSVIYQKLDKTDILVSVQAVCQSWQQISLEHHFWHCLELRCFVAQAKKIAQEAIARSGGYVEQFFAAFIHPRDGLSTANIVTDILTQLADRSTRLKSLILIYPDYIYGGKELFKLVARFPLLEELHISNLLINDKDEFLNFAHSCSKLKQLRLNNRCRRINERRIKERRRRVNGRFESDFDIEAMGIAENMPNLLQLQLIGSHMTSKGLNAILDKCTSLESLDIRGCCYIHLDVRLQRKLDKVKNVKLPDRYIHLDVRLQRKLDKVKNVKLPDHSKENEFDTGVIGDTFKRCCRCDECMESTLDC